VDFLWIRLLFQGGFSLGFSTLNVENRGAMNKRRIEDRASKATECLERAWARLRKVVKHLPPAVMVLLDANSRQPRRGGYVQGHFVQSVWRYKKAKNVHEIGLSPDLFKTPAKLLATLLHEAAHAYLVHNDPENPKHFGGCGRSNHHYHKQPFKKTCEAFGLGCRFSHGNYGWNLTQWPTVRGNDKVPPRYRSLLKFLRKSIPLGTGFQTPQKPPGGQTPQAGHVRLACQCDKRMHRSIYVSESVCGQRGITCQFCGAPFRRPRP
jgi:hypothetical protein